MSESLQVMLGWVIGGIVFVAIVTIYNWIMNILRRNK